ncbi:MAG: hypothetical protein II839_04055 [Kiritimatiellae bacterium]|nr:hypothetical protein [Kiritimatiellia bacterium]
MKRIAILLFAAALPALAETSAFDRARALAAEANWKEALPLYEEALSSSNAVAAMACAVDCLHRLGEHGRVDEPVEKALAAHPDNPEVAVAAARHFRTSPHWASVQDGVFLRGQWGGSKMLDTAERDRVRAVAILLPLAPAVERLPHARHVRVEFFRELAFALRSGRAGDRAWRLFEKTDFSALPEPERDRGGSHASAPAPVGANGDPLFHALPESWDAAETDGERWRWALRRATATYREWEAEARKWGEFEPEPSFESCMLADYFSEQYSPRTLAAHFPDADALDAALGVSGLGDDESVAWTARGARRFRVPDDWNPARFLRPDAGRPAEPEELSLLGQFRLDRLQLDKAAEAFRAAGGSRSNTVAQIVGPRVDLDDRQALQTPAHPPVVAFSHRNAAKVSFVLRPLDLGKLAADVRESVSAGKPFRPFADNRYLYGTGLDHPRQLFEKDGSSPWLGASVAM